MVAQHYQLIFLQRKLNTYVEFDYHNRFLIRLNLDNRFHFKFNLKCILNLYFTFNFTPVFRVKLIFKPKINQNVQSFLKVNLEC